MKKILIGFLLTLIISVSHAIDTELVDKISTLDAASKEWLGVSLAAIVLLSNTGPYSYVPLSHLEETGKIQLVRELELAGYIAIHNSVGLPDGQEPDETFLNLKPTEKGLEVITAIKVHGYNK